ncbi:MAG: chromosomal replication initiator protein DnaA [Dehalococcoidia bacterium]|nr:chromosomal replication initiator protein DnaA [Dehalococcoidia bacterium]
MESANETWVKALGELQTQVSRANFNTWLKNSHGVSFQNGVFVVGTPSAFVAEWLTKRLHSLVKKTLTHVLDTETEVEFVVRGKTTPSPRKQLQSSLADGGTITRSRTDPLTARCTFDTFIVGSCNRLAYATALEIAENASSTFNPLYIYGSTGQGKTHLLQAIGHAARMNGREVLYTTAERFTDDFVLSVKQKRVEEFSARFRSLSLLLFDDIQFLASKRQTLQCFYHIFDELHQNGCQIALTGDSHPRDIHMLGEKLRSRIESGMVASIQPPEFETRLSFLETKGTEFDTPIPPDALGLLAEEVRGNMRQLEGALVYLTAHTRLTGDTISTQSVHNLLTSISSSNGDFRTILQAVSDSFDVSMEDLLSTKRDKKTAFARQVAMYILRTETGCSFSAIGHELGNRNHATVMHGYRKVSDEISENHKLARQIGRIHDLLSSEKQL